jgi:HD-like signal output (HDOD) protein
MKSSILETIKKSAAVPSVPQVVLRFLEIMQDPNFEYRDLVRVLSADAGTVSEVLRLANSALFGVRNKIVSLQHALTLLGPKRVRSLLLGRYLVDSMSKKSVAGLDMSYYWRRSLASSVIASHIAQSLTPRYRDEASIGALLADIGIPILVEAMGETYRPIAANYCPDGGSFSADEEIEAVEVTHGQVSAMVLTHWKLPDVVTNAVNMHQSTSPGEGDIATIARILNASDRIARLLCQVPDPEHVGTECLEATKFVGVETGVLLHMLPTIEHDIEELADALRIDVIPSNVYALVAKSIQDQLSAPAASTG